MREPLPTVLIPGLLCTPRLYAEQIPALWRFGPVTVANHTHDDSMAGIARRILAHAPPRFTLIGLSMGGYVAFEVQRQAPDRVARLALLDTTARPDGPEQTDQRKRQIDPPRLDERVVPAMGRRVRRRHKPAELRRTVPRDLPEQTRRIGRRGERPPQLRALERLGGRMKLQDVRHRYDEPRHREPLVGP